MKTRKVILLQLPIQSHDYEYSMENIPLALGYLQGFAEEYLQRTAITIAPETIMSWGGDAAILHWLEQESPDVIGFSCKLWNLTRTLYLCHELHQCLPQTLLVLGGPEITPDNTYLLNCGGFDVGVVGEGEETFRDLLVSLEQEKKDWSNIPGLLYAQEGHWRLSRQRPLLQSLDKIPSPYLNGIVKPSRLKTIAIESVRGCVHRCSYCYYHKNYPQLRTFSLPRIEAELRWALENGVQDVYFIDPCFTHRPNIQNLLQLLARVNEKRLHIECELNAEEVTPWLAEALARAGVSEIEIGIQTINPTALHLVRRNWHAAAFLQGVKLLREMGIHVIIDVMIGLPGDRLEDMKRTIDFVVEGELGDDLHLYPLSVLPGTKLREAAQKLGISYQEKPPYLVLKTNEIGPEEMYQAFLYAEELTGIDFFPMDRPVLDDTLSSHDNGSELISKIILQPQNHLVAEAIQPFHLGQCLTIFLDDPSWEDKLSRVGFLMRPLLAANPFCLVDWIIPCARFPSEESIHILRDISYNSIHPINQEYFATHFPIRSPQILVFHQGLSHHQKFLLQIPVPVNGGNVIPPSPTLGDSQQVFWVGFSPNIGQTEKTKYLRKIRRLVGQAPHRLMIDNFPESTPAPNLGLSSVVIVISAA